jgi:hypothetical protein
MATRGAKVFPFRDLMPVEMTPKAAGIQGGKFAIGVVSLLRLLVQGRRLRS